MDVTYIKAFTDDKSQINALLSFMESLKIKFEMETETLSPYNSDFVAQIKKADMEFSKGDGIKLSVEEFSRLCK